MASVGDLISLNPATGGGHSPSVNPFAITKPVTAVEKEDALKATTPGVAAQSPDKKSIDFVAARPNRNGGSADSRNEQINNMFDETMSNLNALFSTAPNGKVPSGLAPALGQQKIYILQQSAQQSPGVQATDLGAPLEVAAKSRATQLAQLSPEARVRCDSAIVDMVTKCQAKGWQLDAHTIATQIIDRAISAAKGQSNIASARPAQLPNVSSAIPGQLPDETPAQKSAQPVNTRANDAGNADPLSQEVQKLLASGPDGLFALALKDVNSYDDLKKIPAGVAVDASGKPVTTFGYLELSDPKQIGAVNAALSVGGDTKQAFLTGKGLSDPVLIAARQTLLAKADTGAKDAWSWMEQN